MAVSYDQTRIASCEQHIKYFPVYGSVSVWHMVVVYWVTRKAIVRIGVSQFRQSRSKALPWHCRRARRR